MPDAIPKSEAVSVRMFEMTYILNVLRQDPRLKMGEEDITLLCCVEQTLGQLGKS